MEKTVRSRFGASRRIALKLNEAGVPQTFPQLIDFIEITRFPRERQ
jgi:hypothetical protein